MPSSSLLANFGLMSALADVSIATPACFWISFNYLLQCWLSGHELLSLYLPWKVFISPSIFRANFAE
jgi:hypothetical protein